MLPYSVKADKQNEIVLRKKDGSAVSEEVFVPGAGIEVYNEANVKVAEGVTDEHGEFVLKKLPAGMYKWKEVKAPDGYALNDIENVFYVDAHGLVEGNSTTVITDVQTEVVITKTDLTRNRQG